MVAMGTDDCNSQIIVCLSKVYTWFQVKIVLAYRLVLCSFIVFIYDNEHHRDTRKI